MAPVNLNPARVQHGLARRNLLVIASPILIVILGSLAAQLSLPVLGDWAWAVAVPVYWGSMAVVVVWLSGWQQVKTWFGKPRGSFFWPVLAVLVGLSAFPLLLVPNMSLLQRTPLLTGLWLVFGLVNGTIEEVYWRGFLLKEIRGWPLWLTVTYSSIFFISIHFLMLGSFSASLFNIPFLVILTIITISFDLIFLRTGSLRWGVLSHIVNDWGNLNIFVFMNLIGLF